ncbi:MAG: hypothetical protein KGJ55_02995 [Gammaproteobacteria bacterium]|nr:hypothetical protein [Gammaproteobacteria bacterium]
MSMAAELALPVGTEVAGLVIEKILEVGPYDTDYLVHVDGTPRRLKEFLPTQWSLRDGVQPQPRDAEDRGAMRWWLRSFMDRWQAAARIRHPGFSQVFQVFEANATAYVLTELLPGETLDQLLQRVGAVEPTRLQPLFVPLLEAVGLLHAAGLAPLDLNPGRLRLRADGSACLATLGSLRAPLRLQSGLLMTTGTPPYLAPEQVQAGAAVGPATDIYALAAMLHRAVSGHAIPASAQRAGGALTPLAQASDGRCPEALAAAVDAGLELESAKRPQLTTLLTALGAPADAIVAPPASASPAAPALRRRGPMLAAAGLAAVVAAIAAVLWWPRHPQPEAAVSPAASASGSTVSRPTVAAVPPIATAQVGLDQLAIELLKKQQALDAQRAQLEAEVQKLQQQLQAQRLKAQQEAEAAAQEALQRAQQQAAEAQAKKQQEAAERAAAEARHVAEVVARANKNCSLPAPRLSVDNNLIYDNALQVPGALKLSSGAIRLPPVRLPDGSQQQFEITPDSCAHRMRFY